MAKYSFEFKKKVVLDYLNGKVGTVAPNCIRDDLIHIYHIRRLSIVKLMQRVR